ncbi:hypothetical protein MP228_012908 [Amoeboaphelidium protococcarum]|nr:hypothetical protein MP228_012908 [Amoeboaphelidium protococcarum]
MLTLKVGQDQIDLVLQFYVTVGFKILSQCDNKAVLVHSAGKKDVLDCVCIQLEFERYDRSQQKSLADFIKANGPQLQERLNTTTTVDEKKQQSAGRNLVDGQLAIQVCARHLDHIVKNLKAINYPVFEQPFKVKDGKDFRIPNPNQYVTVDPCGTRLVLLPANSDDVSYTTSVGQHSPLSLTSASAPIEYSGKKIAVLTSGGDSCGMNAAVRAIVRMALVKGCQPYGVMEGYTGLYKGGDMIKKLVWQDVQGILQQGGTVIGTSRCAEFRTLEGRKQAVLNMVSVGIDSLIVIGGDGSLTGADYLRQEWPSMIKQLKDEGKISDQQFVKHQHLSLVGMVGSIDNDMAMTDITIGSTSSVQRICEAVDNISSTAMSHQRAFVVEVMGRNCGWLALMAAIASGADYFLIPECPPADGWEEEMCKLLHQKRAAGKRKNIIIVSEGALDCNLKPIKSEYVKDVIQKKLNIDSRLTTLGHVQRGGGPVLLDRYIATVQGVKAVDAILQLKPEDQAPVIGFTDNKVTCIPLMQAVEATRAVADRIKAKDFEGAFKLRDPEFHACYSAVLATSGADVPDVKQDKKLTIAVLHCGAPAAGMNPATRAIVRCSMIRGHEVLFVSNGFSGLIAGELKKAEWGDVDGWTVDGGSHLGTNRSQPDEDIGLCAYQMQKFGIQGLIVIGGFEAFTAVLKLEERRATYPAFCIPIVHIPSTISNNVPGTELSLGADTALNVIMDACDHIRQSAHSSRKRVFVVEVQGGNCGYLATMAGLGCGATCAYIPEEGLSLQTLAKDSAHLIRQYSSEGDYQGRVILLNESVSKTYTTDIVSAILKEEGKGVYDSRSSILGHIQQGGSPSPMDRVRALRFAVEAVNFVERVSFASIEKHQEVLNCPQKILSGYTQGTGCNLGPNSNKTEEVDGVLPIISRLAAVSSGVYVNDPSSVVVLGIEAGTDTKCTPIRDLIPLTDFENRRPKEAWWLQLNQLIRVLAKYGYSEMQ